MQMNKLKSINILICILLTCVVTTSFAAKFNTTKEWELCRDKAEASVNYQDVGMSGIEYVIKTKCGALPVKEEGNITGAVGMLPYDLVRSKTWKSKFVAITNGRYKPFVERLSVGSPTVLGSEWITGEGNAPHSNDEAAFAINAKSGEVYAVILQGGQITAFGFGSSWDNAPQFIQNWVAVHTR